MTSYYNDNDRYCAAWLRNLIGAGLLPAGHVDDRDIRDVRANDLKGYKQCHFFAGLGGWPYALSLIDYREPAWTGSCPCQPFSLAGNRKGIGDERHLWPFWFALIAQRRPPVIFGEQVAGAKVWLDHVFDDLEAMDYACGAAVLPACAVDARHVRSRLWFVANACGEGLPIPKRQTVQRAGWRQEGGAIAERSGWPVEPDVGRVAHGIPGRVGKLRALGNTVVPMLAAEFAEAAIEAINDGCIRQAA